MIDIIIFAVAISFWLWVAGVLALIGYGARVWVRRVCGNDDVDTAQSDLRKRRGYHGAFNRRHA